MNDFVSQATLATEHLRDHDSLVGVSLTIEQRIVDDGECVACYHLVLADGSALVHDGPASHPDVTIEQDSHTATALRSGGLHAQTAFLTGRLTITGDVRKLTEHGPLLAELLEPSDA